MKPLKLKKKDNHYRPRGNHSKSASYDRVFFLFVIFIVGVLAFLYLSKSDSDTDRATRPPTSIPKTDRTAEFRSHNPVDTLGEVDVSGILGSFAVFDPQADTLAWLRQAGVRRTETVDNRAIVSTAALVEALNGANVLVVGRMKAESPESLVQAADDPSSRIAPRQLRRTSSDLPALMKAALPLVVEGKLSMLVFEQEASTLESLGFRTSDVAPRRMFSVSNPHPLLEGILLPQGLWNWRGSSTLVEPFSKDGSEPPFAPGLHAPTKHARWGNYGTVATVIIEKPHFGAFTPVLETEFDLRYSTLLEWRPGQGRVVFCQADLTGRYGNEPAATKLADNLLSYIQTPPAKSRMGLAAGESTARQLTRLGFEHQRLADIARLPANAADYTLVVGPDTDMGALSRAADALAGFVSRGGQVVMLFQNQERLNGVSLPFAVKSSSRSFTRSEPRASLNADGQALIAGLSISDLHYKGELTTSLLDDLPSGVICDAEGLLGMARHGEGAYIFWQLDPELLNPKGKEYLKTSRWKAYRALAQVLTNAGLASSIKMSEANLMGPSTVAIALGTRWEATRIRATDPDDRSFTAPGYDDGTWDSFAIDKANTGHIDAQARLHFRLTAAEAAMTELLLHAGTYDDFDETYLNGVKLGETTPANTDPERAWGVRRRYPIPDGLLKAGDNVLAIRTWNRNGLTKGWQAIIRGPFVLRSVEHAPVYPYYVEPLAEDGEDNPYRVRWW